MESSEEDHQPLRSVCGAQDLGSNNKEMRIFRFILKDEDSRLR